MKKVALVLGDVNVDLVIPVRVSGQAEVLPRREKLKLHGGGTGGNTAAALSRLGIPTRFIGTVGDDGYGRWSAEELQSEGVDVQYRVVGAEADPHAQIDEGLHRVHPLFLLFG